MADVHSIGLTSMDLRNANIAFLAALSRPCTTKTALGVVRPADFAARFLGPTPTVLAGSGCVTAGGGATGEPALRNCASSSLLAYLLMVSPVSAPTRIAARC